MKSRLRVLALLFAPVLLLLAGTASADCPSGEISPDCGATPSALFDASGTLWVTFVSGEHVYLSRSQDLGKTFTQAVQVNKAGESIYAAGENRPVLTLGEDGQVLVAWTRRTGAAYSGDIRLARSENAGRHFSPARTINDDGLLTSHRFVAMTRTPSGLVYLAWLDKRDQVAALARGEDYPGAALYYTYSSDGGATFAANRKVADNSCECCRLALVPAGTDDARVFWRHIFDEGTVRDHAIATLQPYAETPALIAEPPAIDRATRDHWKLNGCPHHGPAMDADETGYHLTWFSNGENHRGIVYGYRATGEGRTTHVTTMDSAAGVGHPAIHAAGQDVSLVWKFFDGKQMNLRASHSADGGRSWSPATVIRRTDGASDHPHLLKFGPDLYVSWHTVQDGYLFFPVNLPPEGEQQ